VLKSYVFSKLIIIIITPRLIVYHSYHGLSKLMEGVILYFQSSYTLSSHIMNLVENSPCIRNYQWIINFLLEHSTTKPLLCSCGLNTSSLVIIKLEITLCNLNNCEGNSLALSFLTTRSHPEIWIHTMFSAIHSDTGR